jgi:glycosyltransferase involved in cell wall biosynthesis
VTDTPAVSVLVPCFRSAAYLGRALDSVLAQTFEDWEAVVVDNASDDGTHELALAYAARDRRIRVHRNPENLGPVRNWRRCAELARGRAAGLLFSDDWYGREFLAEAVPFLADPRMAFVYSSVRIVKDVAAPGNAPVYYAMRGPRVRPTADFLRASYGVVPRVEAPVSPGCALFRREDLARGLSAELPDRDRYGWLAHGAGPDVLVYLQACLERPLFAHLREPRVFFLSHADNLTWRPDVGRAYAVALAEFLDLAAPRIGLAAEKARAKLVERLSAVGEHERSENLSRRLGLVGRFSLAKQRWRAARSSR